MLKSVRVILTLATFILFQSFTPANYSLLLKSGIYTLPEGQIETALTGKAHNGQYFRIMQFYTTPTQQQKEKLQNLGISFFGYIPNNAYLVSIPKSVRSTQLTQFNVRSIGQFTPNMKLSEAVASRELPSWSKQAGGKLKLIVAFYPTVDDASIQSELRAMNISFEDFPMEKSRRVFVDEQQIDDLASSALIYYIQEDEDPGSPENNRARSDHRIAAIQGNYNGGTYYDGTGVVVACGDDGDVGDHLDYTGRLTSHADPSNGDHGDHVIGTVFGAGNRNPIGKGMAPGADLEYFDYFGNGGIYLWDADTMYDALNVRITQSSYSNGSNSYTTLTREMDKQVREKRGLMHVFSAGNAGSGWSTITGGHKQAKNVIATGNVTYTDFIAGSSSRGPAHDGRVKPDICAVGTNVFSTTDLTTSGYTSKTGTSMSSPGASGTLATYYQAYKENNNQMEPDGGLMKAIMMNTADDLGNNGPDYIYGYGRINALQAIRTIENNYIHVDSVTQGGADTVQITVGTDIAELRVMVYWTDPEALPNNSRALVNNLDFTLYNASGSSSWQPWVLNPNSESAAAVRATDSLNNAEQVTIDNPAVGDYKVVVNGTNVPTGPQKYYIVYSLVPNEIKLTYPIGGEHFVPGVTEVLRWDAPDGNGNFTLQYSTDGGSTYTNITTAGSSTRHFDWTVPNTVTGEALVRVTRAGQSSTSEANFSIIGVPSGLNVVWACPDSLMFSWNPVPGATGYQVHRIGAKFMDSIGYTTSTSFVVKNYNPTKTTWLSVKALGTNDCEGRRALAYEKTPGTFGCNISQDAGIESLSPTLLPSCQGGAAVPVTIEVKNSGQQNLVDIPVAYRFNNGSLVRDTIFQTITPGSSVSFTFSTTLSVSTAGVYQLAAYADLSSDQNFYNDTLIEDLDFYPSSLAPLPYTQPFDSFSFCSTQSDCEATICNMSNGWKNVDNTVQDDIDFRTNNGATPSGQTGPTGDHTSGSGRYVYLEASGGCDGKVAQLISPCFDLSNTNSPQATIWYHMSGVEMGELHVDVLADGEWNLDVIQPIIGDQSANWTELIVNLNSFVGKTVNVRFRGITGTGYRSDLALDDFEIKDAVGLPVADFTASALATCPNVPITLLDQTLQGPTSWSWTISPSTFTYVGGTSSMSQNPEVSFTALGQYNIELIATNQFGSDTAIKVGFIDVNSGDQLPIQEDFQTVFPPVNWTIENPDGDVTWQKSGQIVGSNGFATFAAFMDNFNYNINYEEDILQSTTIDLTIINNAYLTFDVAYAAYSASFFDGLRVEVSADCGLTYTDTVYLKEGQSLATVPNLTNQFTPGAASHWRTDSVDLSTYGGSTITMRFVSMGRYGNSLYLDNINLLQSGVQPPVASFTASTNSTCVGDTVVFTSTSSGSISSYSWDFGPGAVPPTANTPGPHAVVYSPQGPRTPTLTVSNSGGSTVDNSQITVNTTPAAAFNAVNNDTLTVQFTDLSSNTPTAWSWQFGDGNTSTIQNPLHTYAAGGTYSVTLSVQNTCGSSDSTFTVNVSGIGIDEGTLENAIRLQPNPAVNNISLIAQTQINETFTGVLIDISGKQLMQFTWNPSVENEKDLNVSELANGVYMLRLNSESSFFTKRIVIRK